MVFTKIHSFYQTLWFSPKSVCSPKIPSFHQNPHFCQNLQFSPKLVGFLSKSTVFQDLQIFVQTADLGKLSIFRFLSKAMVFAKTCGFYQYYSFSKTALKTMVFENHTKNSSFKNHTENCSFHQKVVKQIVFIQE